MDLSTVKAITIPEGSVKRITDSNGVVLWSASPIDILTYAGGASSYLAIARGDSGSTNGTLFSNIPEDVTRMEISATFTWGAGTTLNGEYGRLPNYSTVTTSSSNKVVRSVKDLDTGTIGQVANLSLAYQEYRDSGTINIGMISVTYSSSQHTISYSKSAIGINAPIDMYISNLTIKLYK